MKLEEIISQVKYQPICISRNLLVGIFFWYYQDNKEEKGYTLFAPLMGPETIMHYVIPKWCAENYIGYTYNIERNEYTFYDQGQYRHDQSGHQNTNKNDYKIEDIEREEETFITGELYLGSPILEIFRHEKPYAFAAHFQALESQQFKCKRDIILILNTSLTLRQK